MSGKKCESGARGERERAVVVTAIKKFPQAD